MAAKSLNKVLLIGNLTKDPELRSTPSGKQVASFGLATSNSWRDSQSGEQKESVEFHNVVAWDKLAEICNSYLKKGSKVYVEGSLTTHSWDAEDGSKRYRTDIRANDIIMLSPKGSVESAGSSEETSPEEDVPVDIPGTSGEETLADDELPF